MSLPTIEEASLLSLQVSAQRVGEATTLKIAGTAFLVRRGGHDFLVTNRHVLTNREPDNPDVPLEGASALPEFLRVEFSGTTPNTWTSHRVELYDAEKQAIWLAHPDGPHVDVVAIPLQMNVPDTTRRYHDLEPGMPVSVGITDDVSIVGFPFDVPTDGHLPIWSRGTIATEPEIDYLGDKAFLIDSRTRPGQSGSPVISYTPAGRLRSIAGRGSVVLGNSTYELLGIYSGRVHDKSDLGRVWRREVIMEVIDARRRDAQVWE